MIKRSPAFAIPNSPKAFWNPKNIPNVPMMLAKMAGFDLDTLTFPEIESYNPVLIFALSPGQTITSALPSKDGTWILLEKMATIVTPPQQTMQPAINDLVTVSSYFVSDISLTNVTLIEEQPVTLVFGTGEWQSSFLPETWSSVNNRVFSVKNLSSYFTTVSLGFKLSRVAPKVIY